MKTQLPVFRATLNTTLIILVIGIVSAFTASPGSPVPSGSMETVSMEAPVGGAYLVFAGKRGGNIKKSEIKAHTELQVDGCARGSKIFMFTLAVNRKGKVIRFHAKSNVLSADMVTALNGLEAGDSFEFISTKAYMPDGKDEVDVHSQTFVVVASYT